MTPLKAIFGGGVLIGFTTAQGLISHHDYSLVISRAYRDAEGGERACNSNRTSVDSIMLNVTETKLPEALNHLVPWCRALH